MKPLRACLCLLALALCCQGAAPALSLPGLPDLLMVEPMPCVREHTRRLGMPTGELPKAAPEDASRPGDRLIVLASFLEEASVRQQWIVELRLEPPTDEERREAPRELLQHTSLGGQHRFSATPRALSLRTHGPFTPATKPGDRIPLQEARALVGTEFLGMGLHGAAEALERIRGQVEFAGQGDGINLESGPEPFPPERVAANRKVAERIGISEAQERAFAMATPALMEFFNAVQRTPGLSDILFRVLERPPLLSLLSHRGLVAGLQLGVQGTQPQDLLDGALIHQLPVTLILNGSPALQARLYVTAPRPPLRNTAGVFGILAAAPAGSASSQMLALRVVGGSRD